MKFALRLGLSILLIAVLFTYVVDGRQMLRILSGFSLAYLILALAVVTLDRALMAYKWTVLLKAQGHRLGLLDAVTIYCTSMIWGLALPATVGADAIRAVMVTRRGFDGTDVVTSIIIERAIGFILALALGVVSLLVLRGSGVLPPTYDTAVYAGIAVLLGSIALLFASMNERLIGWGLARLSPSLRESKVVRLLTGFTNAYHALGAARRAMAQFCVLTVVEQLLWVFFTWTLARGLGVPVDLLLMLGVLPVAMLISRLPVSFDGLGIFEVVFVGLLLLAGISAESSLAIAISGRVIQIAAFLPWWFAHVLNSGAVRPPPSLSQRT